MFFEMKNKNLKEDWFLTLQVPTPQNVKTHPNNSSVFADKFFEYVWPFCGVGA